MKARRIGVLVVGVLILVIASLFLWARTSPSILQANNCTTNPLRNPQVWLQKVTVTKTVLPNGHTVTTVSEYPGIRFEVGDINAFTQRLDDLSIWDGSGVFNTQSMQYITPQHLCIVLVPDIQQAGKVVSATDENKVLQSYSSDFDYSTDTFKLNLHFDSNFYKEKANDSIAFSYVLSYAVMERLYDLSTPEEKRVMNDLEKRKDDKKVFLEPFTAKFAQTNPSLIRVTQFEWPATQ